MVKCTVMSECLSGPGSNVQTNVGIFDLFLLDWDIHLRQRCPDSFSSNGSVDQNMQFAHSAPCMGDMLCVCVRAHVCVCACVCGLLDFINGFGHTGSV